MDRTSEHDATTEFMLAEYEDLYQNVMHMEDKLFGHLSFFTTLFTGILAASVAIYGLVGQEDSSLDQHLVLAFLALLFALFAVVGHLEVRMATELRIRKIKFVEGLTQMRQYFVDRDESIAGYLVLPVGLKKAPPFLRKRSKDRIQLFYMSFVNGISSLIAWLLLSGWILDLLRRAARQACWPEVVRWLWFPMGLALFYLVCWVFCYNRAKRLCEHYDQIREKRVGGKSEYDFL